MAFKLPLREDFECWTAYQVAEFLKQCSLQECAGVVERTGMNGHTFLNMTDHELHKFNVLYQPQLQKMMHEIKNNERGIVQRFKKFQTDQVSMFCRTGKDAWDRLTNKPPPTVPRRDYGPEPSEEDEWSDEESGSDYDNPNEADEYVVPSDDTDDASYEPTPTEQPTFTPQSHRFNDRNGGYVDKKSNILNRPLPKPIDTLPKPPPPPPPNAPNKALPNPFPKPRTQQLVVPPLPKKPTITEDDDDYINPDEVDNYIDPNENPSPSPSPGYKPPVVNRASKPGQSPPARTQTRVEDPDLYEVPENEPKPSPPSRGAPPPRRSLPPKQETQEAFKQSPENDRRPDFSKKPVPVPSPIPRNMKPKVVPPKQPRMPDIPPRDINSNIEKPQIVERHRIQSSGSEPSPVPPTPSRISAPKIPIQKPPEPASRFIFNPGRSTVEQEAGVLHKEWYSPSCDRKAAEEALQASSKDGSFLVRKSTGQDSKQPFTLAVFYNRRVYNIPVRYIESTRQYALGREKTGEEKFSSVAEMIENHQRTQLVLVDSQTNTKDFTKLEYPVRAR
ncbi:B-cell linker protein isoform X3 [Hyperolius riggenbachi]|uniref:B-cell linker protein isoform X3 n=1 Tax=Hyperolius riggenbachi TaxID=752182 RepID=UPI0035A39B38